MAGAARHQFSAGTRIGSECVGRVAMCISTIACAGWHGGIQYHSRSPGYLDPYKPENDVLLGSQAGRSPAALQLDSRTNIPRSFS